MPHIAHHKHLNDHKKQTEHLFLNRLVLAMAILEPLMTLPQVYEVWIRQQTEGVSFVTWSFFVGSAIVWLIYGLKIKSVPLIVSSTLWIIVESSIVVGLAFY